MVAHYQPSALYQARLHFGFSFAFFHFIARALIHFISPASDILASFALTVLASA
jgi:hypothetical protein